MKILYLLIFLFLLTLLTFYYRCTNKEKQVLHTEQERNAFMKH